MKWHIKAIKSVHVVLGTTPIYYSPTHPLNDVGNYLRKFLHYVDEKIYLEVQWKRGNKNTHYEFNVY